MADIWIDISNTPHVIFFSSLIEELKENNGLYISYSSRGETENLLDSFDIESENPGKIPPSKLNSPLYSGLLLLKYVHKIPKFDIALSLESTAPIPTTRIRRKELMLFLDNELKHSSKLSFGQKVRNEISKFSPNIIVPKVTGSEFSKIYNRSNLYTYDGYKEHISISNYSPDKEFLGNLPFNKYVILRPESLSSLYVKNKESIAPDLLNLFTKNDVNVVFLPRKEKEKKLGEKYDNVYVPPEPLNGLDLSYHAEATLTGSGTMAREAAVLGTTSVSFFPEDELLAVDQDLVKKGKIFHSREPEEIVNYVLKNWKNNDQPEFEKARKIKKEILEIINDKIAEIETKK